MARHIISEERESCKCDKNTRRGKRRGSGKSISEGGMQREARAGEGKKKKRVGEGWMNGGGGGVSWVECGQRLITSAGSICRDRPTGSRIRGCGFSRRRRATLKTHFHESLKNVFMHAYTSLKMHF